MRTTYVGVAVFTLVYVALDLNKLYALRYGADLGTYLQTFVNLQHGSSWNFGEWKQHFAVHDSWVLAALVPLIALLPRAETLIVVQVVAVAAAAIPLVLLAREVGVSARAANLLGVAYLLSPATQGLGYDNFSENVFVPLLASWGVIFARKRLLWPTLAAGALLAGLKEDEILFVIWFGAACALWWDRRIGLGLVVVAGLIGAVFVGVEHLVGVRPNLPPYGLRVLNVGGKLSLVALLLAPFAFAPVAIGRRLLLGAPLLAEIVFMQPWNYEPSRLGSHYVAPLLAGTAIAAAFGLRRVSGFARAMVPCALVVTLLFNDTVLHLGRWPYIVDWSAYARAVALRDSGQAAFLARRDEGVWAVSAANPNVRLDPQQDPKFPKCPAYDTNAGAFFSSLRGRTPGRMCGGAPIGP
jgi:uncharacterized membrane protein